MGITGEKFLTLSRAAEFIVSGHALDRIQQRTGAPVGIETAAEAFQNARQLRYADMLLLGYRPRYGQRIRQGQKSWYFRFELAGTELVAVVTEGQLEGQYVWITTYTPNRQTEQLRVAYARAITGIA